MSEDHAVVVEQSHADRAVDLLLSQDRRSPRLVGFVRALMAGVQRLEHEAFAVLTATDLETAEGAFLARLGAWVDEPKGNLTDDEYRAVIRTKLAAVHGTGNTDNVIEVAQLSSAPSTVTHWTMYPAGGRLEIRRTPGMSDAAAARTARFLEIVRPTGVALFAYRTLVDGFGFDDDPDALGWDEGIWAETLTT